MEHIEQDQVRDGAVAKGQMIGVADEVEPWIRKEVRRDGFGKVLLEVADAGANFDHIAGNLWVDEGENSLVKPIVNILQKRFSLPCGEVSLNLDVMLVEWVHAKNFKRRAANM